MEQKNKLIILQPVRDGIFDITNYHQLISGSSSALEIAREIKNALSLLKEFPLMGTVHDDPLLAKQGYRKFRAVNVNIKMPKRGCGYFFRLNLNTHLKSFLVKEKPENNILPSEPKNESLESKIVCLKLNNTTTEPKSSKQKGTKKEQFREEQLSLF